MFTAVLTHSLLCCDPKAFSQTADEIATELRLAAQQITAAWAVAASEDATVA